jgi:hypothetical protein
MKIIDRRIRKLEETVAHHEIGGPSPAEVVRERRRRRLEGSGLPFEEGPPDPLLYARRKRPTIAEVMRSARTWRLAEAASRRAAMEEQKR